MTHDEAVRWLDQIENSLVRAETAKKDVDLVVVLRCLYAEMKEKVKETANERNH